MVVREQGQRGGLKKIVRDKRAIRATDLRQRRQLLNLAIQTGVVCFLRGDRKKVKERFAKKNRYRNPSLLKKKNDEA